MRIEVFQPATSRPELVVLDAIGTSWETVAEAPDYTVPDETGKWPDERDPADATRRIQPGQTLITTPLFIHNADAQKRWVEVQVVAEDGTTAKQLRTFIPAGYLFSHPIAGLTLTKFDLTSANGARLQVRAEVGGFLSLTASTVVGSAEQDLPTRAAS